MVLTFTNLVASYTVISILCMASGPEGIWNYREVETTKNSEIIAY